MLELITISNTRSERVNENITTLCTCQQNFMLVGVSVIETGVQPEEDEEEHGKTVKYNITSITPVLQDLLFFSQNH